MGSITNPFAPGGGGRKADDAVSNEPVEASAAVEPEPADVEQEPAVEEVPAGSAREVMEWVGDDKDRARQALEAEEARGNSARKGLTRDLNELLEN